MNAQNKELTELIHACLDGRATDEQAEQLNARLREDPGARDLYLQLADMHSSLAVDELLWFESNPVSGASGSKVQSMRQPWLTWRPLTAAAAGVVLGMLCTSVVFAYAGISLGRGVTLLQESFESGPAPLVSGVPLEPGKWSGDFTEVVGEQQGVRPETGMKMLRFLRADYAGKVKPEGSYIADVYQLIDLRPYQREFVDGGAVVRLSAAFNAFAFSAEEAFGCSVSLHAMDAEMALSGATQMSDPLLTDCLAMARNSRLRVDRDPTTWQSLGTELRLPANTGFILVRIGLEHSNKAQRRGTFDGHYIDDVRLTLARRAPLP
jgi:hypothetical protein